MSISAGREMRPHACGCSLPTYALGRADAENQGTAKITSVKKRIAMRHCDRISRSSIKGRLVWSRKHLPKVSVDSNRFKELTVESHMPRSANSHLCCPRSNLGITLQGWKRCLLC